MPRILDRLTNSIGLSEDRARAHLRGGYVRVGRGDGLVVIDPEADVDDQDRVRFQPESATERLSQRSGGYCT